MACDPWCSHQTRASSTWEHELSGRVERPWNLVGPSKEFLARAAVLASFYPAQRRCGPSSGSSLACLAGLAAKHKLVKLRWSVSAAQKRLPVMKDEAQEFLFRRSRVCDLHRGSPAMEAGGASRAKSRPDEPRRLGRLYLQHSLFWQEHLGIRYFNHRARAYTE